MITLSKSKCTCPKSVKTAHLNLTPASDEAAERTIGRAATSRPTLDHNMVYLASENFKFRLFYASEISTKRCKICQNSSSQLDAGV
jgi:hypothetical protein